MNINYDIKLEDLDNMMNQELSIRKPRTIKFVSSQNSQMNAVVAVNFDEIDGLGVAEVIAKVIKDGGIFGKNPETEEYFFIPWPCAIVTITN